MAITFARITGFILLITGIAGLFSNDVLLGLNSALTEDVIHVLVGILALTVGFVASGVYAWPVVKILGPAFALLGIVGFFSPSIFGLVQPPLGVLDHVIHLALGIWGTSSVYATKPRT